MEHYIADRPNALITGVSRRAGLGFATAQRLAEQGFRVFMGARDVAKAEPLAAELREHGHAAHMLFLDLADPESICEATCVLEGHIDCLDVLVHNASPMPDFETTSAIEVDIAAAGVMLEVNVLGSWALTQKLLPLVRKAPRGRIVSVSSAAVDQIRHGADPRIRAPAYSISKLTANILIDVLARALADTPILVNAVDPGAVATHPMRGVNKDDRPAAEAAVDIVRVATLPPGAPSGCLFRHGTSMPVLGI